MFVVGTLVKFVWWSNYRAPSVVEDHTGHVTWHEVKPGDAGIVLCEAETDFVVVLFSNIDSILKIHHSMLTPI